MKSSLRSALISAAAATLVITTAGLASGDTVDLDNGNANSLTVIDGGSGTFSVTLVADPGGSAGDPVDGCNADALNPVHIAFTPDDGWASIAPSSIDVTDCTTSHDRDGHGRGRYGRHVDR